MSETLIGKTLNHFKIVDKLGQGGMALVYRAHQDNLNRTVALKILPPEMTYDKSYIARFQQEARAAAGLEHSHIVPIYEIGDAEGFYYIAMKYIEGGTLKDLIEQDAPMPITRVLDLLEPIGRALDYAHKRGVVHRDIKPSNVMITPEGWVYLTDFGLARGNSEGTQGLTQAGTIMGTPEYMSPEQAQGLPVGAASDLYAFAIMAYEMLTKNMPFTGDNPQSVLVARVLKTPKPPSEYTSNISGDVEDVLMKALARAPEQRFRSAAAIIKALREASVTMRVPPPDFKAGESDATIALPKSPSQASYPPPSIPPTSTPSMQGNPASYPPAGIPSGQNRTPSQPSMQGTPPSYPPSYPPSGSNAPTYMTNQAQPAQYGLPAANTLPAAQSTPHYQAPNTPSYPPSVPVQRSSAGKLKGKGLWIGVGAAVLLGLIIVGFLVAGGDKAKGAINRGNAAFERKGGLAEAQKEYQAAVSANPKNFEAQQRLAFVLLMRGRLDDAEKAANTAINLEPNNALGHSWMSLIHSNQIRRGEALAQGEEAVRLDGNNPLAYVARSVARSNKGLERSDQALLQSAIDDASKAIELAQSGNRVQQSLAHYAKGFANWRMYQYFIDQQLGPGTEFMSDGIDNFNRAIGLQDQLPLLHTNLGFFYILQYSEAQLSGQPTDELSNKASAEFETAIALDPEYSGGYAGKCRLLYFQNDYENAIRQCDEAINRNSKDVNALVGRGFAYRSLGDNNSTDPKSDYEDAAKNFEQILEVSPEMFDMYITLGYHYLYQLGQPDKATATFERALALDANFAPAIVGIGNVLHDAGSYDEAIAKFDEGLAIQPDYVEAHIDKARTLADLGKNEEAIKELDLAIQSRPKYALAYVRKAHLLQELNKIEDAKAILEFGLTQVSDSNKAYLQSELDALK